MSGIPVAPQSVAQKIHSAVITLSSVGPCSFRLPIVSRALCRSLSLEQWRLTVCRIPVPLSRFPCVWPFPQDPDARGRSAAEQFLLQCRQGAAPVLIQATLLLLEQPRTPPSVLYHSLTILRETVLRQWNQLTPQQLQNLQSRVLAFAAAETENRPPLPAFVFNAALRVASVSAATL